MPAAPSRPRSPRRSRPRRTKGSAGRRSGATTSSPASARSRAPTGSGTLEQGDNRGAGRAALWLVYSHGYILAQPAIAGGWAERALRLLEGLEPGPEHVWLAISTAAATPAVDTVETRRLVREAADIGRGLPRPDLEAMGLASEGLVLVGEGEVAGGMRLLDEAAAAAIASDSDDFAAVGHTCCAMLAACALAGDVERASEWSERTTAYAGRYGFRPLYATCLHLVRGRLDLAWPGGRRRRRSCCGPRASSQWSEPPP